MRLNATALLFTAFALVPHATAELLAVSQSAVYDAGTNLVTFSVLFNQQPDFTDTDQYGRVADSFEYLIYGDPTLPYPAFYDSVINGDQFSAGAADTLTVRNTYPSSPDPAADGWGSLREEVPFLLSGDTLTFSTPLPLISDHSSDGNFTYDFLTTSDYGSLDQYITSNSTVTPEPGSALLLVTGATAAWTTFKLRRKPLRRAPAPVD